MIIINEWLANPVGTDTAGEWVELRNTGVETATLAGWLLRNKAGKEYVMHGTIPAGGYLVLPRDLTKLALRNSDEELTLTDAGGRVMSQSAFPGSMSEGKSVGFTDGHYLLMQPSPGAANLSGALAYPALDQPLGQVLNPGPGWFPVLGLALGTAAMLVGVAIFLYQHTHEDKDLVH